MKKIIKEHITNNYYCDINDDGIREVWQPFEEWTEEQIEEQIEKDIIVMTRFIDNNKQDIIDYIKSDNYICCECFQITEDSFYRDNENETVCEECYIEFLGDIHDKKIVGELKNANNR